VLKFRGIMSQNTIKTLLEVVQPVIAALAVGTVYAIILAALLAAFPSMLVGRAVALALVPMLIVGFIYWVKSSETGGK
jgi:hypothetical protein